MDISGIGANYYQAGYTNSKATKAETGNTFAEIASQKVVEADKQYCLDRASAAFDTIGAHAPDKVRQAWLEASEETGSNGFSITSDGKHFHIPKLLVQHAIRWYNGEVDPDKMQKLITMNTQLIDDSLELRNCALKYNLGHSAIILLSCNAVKTFGIDIRNLI